MRLPVLLAIVWVGLGSALAQHVRVADRVFVVSDRPGATTRFEMIVNAGSSDEAGGEVTGIAHYLEHLLLVGRNAGHSEAAVRMIADASANGWTNDRATVYMHTIPSRADGGASELETLFRFYARRLKDFAVTDANAARERNVVLQEHDLRIQSSPTARFYRDFNRALIPDHPAGAWTIGTRDSIRAMTLDQARAFHQVWYRPNNVWFVVRGAIAPERVKAIAQEALAEVATAPLPERLHERRPALDPPAGDLRMRSADIARPMVTVSRLVRIEENDRLRSQAIVNLLSAFAGSRFVGSAHDRLVETQRVAAEDLSVWIRRVAPATFAISLAASTPVDKTPEALKAAMNGYIDSLAREGLPNASQLARLKKRVLDQWTRSGAQPAEVHARLVSWLADGRSPERLDEWPKLIEGVGGEDIAGFAAGLSGPGRQLAGVLEPEGDAP